jgi:hypothetical protein
MIDYIIINLFSLFIETDDFSYFIINNNYTRLKLFYKLFSRILFEKLSKSKNQFQLNERGPLDRIPFHQKEDFAA